MYLIFKKFNIFLKKNNVNLMLTFFYFVYIIKNLKNFFKFFLFNRNLNNLYIPNLAIRNIIYIDPNKIKYVNSVPLKFNKSTKFIFDFNWDKTNRILETDSHPTYVTCRELFVEGKKLEETKNYFYFKDQIIKEKKYKNCKNHDDIIKFLKKKIDLFKSIKLNGVKKSLISNLQFMIDKNYNLVKINSGNHRMMMSRILNLKKIPIEVMVIHKECLRVNKSNKIQIKQINDVIKKIEKKYN